MDNNDGKSRKEDVMKIINQSWHWLQKPELPLEVIETAGRACYKSEDQRGSRSAEKFVAMLVKRGHHSVLEHVSASVKFITNRGVLAELTRHRLASFSVESTRYVDYDKEMTFIQPVWCESMTEEVCMSFAKMCAEAEGAYRWLRAKGWRPEQAREVLPNALKTGIVMTCNMREWMHVFKLRTSKAAHPQIRALMRDCLQGFQKEIPVLFDGLGTP